MTTLPVAGFFSDSARINSEAKTAWDDLLKVHRELQGGSTRTTLTISSGSVTPTLGIHLIAVESGATDNLDNIVQTNHPNGRLLIISAADGAEDIVVRNAQGGAGQIFTVDGISVTLNVTRMYITLQRTGTDWTEIGRFYGANVIDFRTYLGLGTAAVLNTGVAEGNIPLVSDALMQGKHTIWIPSKQMEARTTNGATRAAFEFVTNDIMIDYFTFDPDTSEFVQVMIAMPKSWDEGTVTVQYFWIATSGSGVVSWAVKARAHSDGSLLDQALSALVQTNDTLEINDINISAESTAITIAGTPAEGDLVVFEFLRNASSGADTHSSDAQLLGVNLFVTIDDGNDD